MTTRLLILLTVILSFFSAANAKESIDIQQHSIESVHANSKLTFKIALPWGWEKSKTYPVIYTTSGGSRFDTLVHQIDWLSHVSMGPIPQFIIVNVPQVSVPSDMHPKFVSASGIAHKKQLAVLKDEVIPYVNSTFKTQGFNVLEGFSSNANFVLHTYVEDNSLFNGFLVHSPALALDKTALVQQMSVLKSETLSKNAPLFLSLGPFEENAPLFDSLRSTMIQKDTLHFSDYRQHNFLSVATLSLTEGLEWLFADMSPSVNQFTSGGAKQVKAYYQQLERKYNKVMDASSTLIDLSFYYAKQGDSSRAIATIDTLLESQPNNIFYLTRKAVIQKDLGLIDDSKHSFIKAQQLAIASKNDDALSYIAGELSKLD